MTKKDDIFDMTPTKEEEKAKYIPGSETPEQMLAGFQDTCKKEA